MIEHNRIRGVVKHDDHHECRVCGHPFDDGDQAYFVEHLRPDGTVAETDFGPDADGPYCSKACAGVDMDKFDWS